MSWWPVALAPLAYLLGTFPSAALVSRSSGHEVLQEGSGNPGASNVYRLAGWQAGAVVLVADIAKGALAAAGGMLIDGRTGAFVLGVAAVVGHIWPVFRRFRGGKGVATAAGALAVLFPLIVLGGAIVWFVIARGFRRASIGSLVVAIGVPLAVAISGYPGVDVAATIALASLVIVRHRANIARLLRGDEPTLGSGTLPSSGEE